MDFQWINIRGGCIARVRFIPTGEESIIGLRKEQVSGKQWAIFWDENDPSNYSILRNYRTDNPHTGSRKEAQFFADYWLRDFYELIEG